MCLILILTSNVPKLGYFEGQLQLALSTVRTLNNTSFAAINRLPQEVLALVPTHFDPKIPGDTLNVSHVCRYWRMALVSSRALWTIADTACMIPSLIQLCLDRSGAMPLDITLGKDTPPHILQQFIDRAPQIRFLSFEIMRWSRWKAISERFSVSPLHTLLGLQISADTWTDPTGPDSALFPHASNLRHLSVQISGYSVPILSYVSFPSLTTIQINFEDEYLHRTMIPAHLTVTPGPVLGILRSSPLLEDVSLTFRELAAEPGVSHHIVPLPRLRKFIISCNPTPIPLLTSIDFPPAAWVLARTGHEGECPTHDQMFSLGQHLSHLVSGSDELFFYSSKTLIKFMVHLKRDGKTRIKLEFQITKNRLPLGQALSPSSQPAPLTPSDVA